MAPVAESQMRMFSGGPGAAGAKTAPTLTLGIDEAGRGPILGPMVMAAVALEPGAARALTRAGLADSKKYGHGAEARARRAALASMIRARATFVVVEVVEADEIDVRVDKGELNVLERERARRMITLAPSCKRIVADGARIFGSLRDEFPELRAYDNGESRHASMAAESVVAKDERDRRFALIAERWRSEFGVITGGGYINDATRAFLRAFKKRFGDLPPETRRSWDCVL
jgi:ribonuclease HII